MEMILLSLLAKIAPYAIAAASFFGLYFYIKGKGRSEERAKIEKQQREEYEQINTRLQEAQRQDEEIDSATAQRIREIEERAKNRTNTNPDRFKF